MAEITVGSVAFTRDEGELICSLLFDFMSATGREVATLPVFHKDGKFIHPSLVAEDEYPAALFVIRRLADLRTRIAQSPALCPDLNRELHDELSVRTANWLGKRGIRTWGDLCKKTDAWLLAHRGFGFAMHAEIKAALVRKNLSLSNGAVKQ